MNQKAMIAMSGGVDSSVAACLVKEQGYSCIGVTLKLFQGGDIGAVRERTCCSLEDVEDARSVARKLGMPYYIFNFSEHFREKVIEKFIQSYENGMTPNPCIDCNRYLKFGKLFHRAKELGCDFVVTGHYARIEYDAISSRYLLKKSLHPDKDQSYALYAMTQEQLAHTLFPLGEMTKQEVRWAAGEHGFVNAEKQDSQDICFVQNGRYADFIEQYTRQSYPEGNFVDTKGRCLGTHKGIIRYTIGQRKGLGIPAAEPLYVCDISPESNTVTLGADTDLYTKTLTAKDINLIAVSRLDKPIRLKVKTRYRQPEQWAVITQTDEDTIKVEFDEPQRAVTKGQAVVLYDGDIVLGGGTIQ